MPGKAVQEFFLPSAGGGSFKLSEQRGEALVVYFYPKDNTPGCTVEGADLLPPDAGEGAIAREWRAVKVPGHVKEVLNFVKTL